MPMSIPRICRTVPAFVLLTATCPAVFAQTAPVPASTAPLASPAPLGNTTGPALAGLRPALDKVGGAVGNLRIIRWKAPVDLRQSTLDDVSSIQRDLTATLPPLLDQAQASGSPGGPVAPSFAIFRNIDALYDVLLRVTEMANLAGSSDEAASLEDARATLESARAQLGSSLLESVSAQDTQLAHFRAMAAAPPVKPPDAAPPAKIVVDDGPQAAPKPHHKKKPATPSTTTTTTPPSQ
jgi:hypothetical protein